MSLTKQARNVAKLMSVNAPDKLVRELADYKNSNSDSGITGVHVYPLGGLRRSAKWSYAVTADAGRLALSGWSYGGFIAAWAVSQTDRFRAAVMGAGISNWVSFHGTSEIPEWDRTFWQADPYERDGLYRRSSPITHVANVKTPTLILHGEEDRIVPVCQAQEFYRALKDHGVETKLVTYPRQGHPIREKKHQRDLLGRVMGWYRQHLLD